MKLLNVIFLHVFLLASGSLLAQTQVFGTEKLELSASITASNNGLAILNTTQTNSNNLGFQILFTDTSFNALSEKYFSSSEKDIAAKITTQADGFLLLGTTYSPSNNNLGEGDFLLIKSDPAGNMIWSKTFGGSHFDGASSMTNTPDGGAILVGTTHSNDGDITLQYGAGDALVIKVDANGNKQWSKNFGGSRSDQINDIQATFDGGYIMIGSTFSQNGTIGESAGHSDIWVTKINALGDMQWSKTFGDAYFDYGQSIQSIPEGYILVGTTSSVDYSSEVIVDRFDHDLVAIKINNTGQIIWQKTYGSPNYDVGMAIYPIQADNSYLITGYKDIPTSNFYIYETHKDAWTLKLNHSGDKIWETFSSSSPNETGLAIGTNTTKSVVAVLGNTDATSGSLTASGSTDIWLTKYHDIGAFSIFLGDNFSACSGITHTLDATIAGCDNCTYKWEDNSTNPIRQVTPNETTTYSVTATNSPDVASAQITITITPSPTVSATTIDPDQGQSNGAITVTPQAGTAPFQILWTHGPTTFIVNELPQGDYPFTLTDAHNCSLDSTITLTDIVANTNLDNQPSIQLYPNPTTNHTNVQIQTDAGIQLILVYDSQGNLVLTQKNNNHRIIIQQLPAGLYYMDFLLKNGQKITQKLVIY